MNQRLILTLFVALAAAAFSERADARVVINEIMYHAPGNLDDLEFVELHNAGDDPVDLAGWKFTKGLKFEFKPGTRIPGGGFVVLCRNEKRFREHYASAPANVVGTFDSKLSNNGERLELSDARGRVVDTVKYQDSPPWPLGADGMSGSLERICPDSGGDFFVNWMASRLSPDRKRASGTPGQTNSCHSETLPPIVSRILHKPEKPIAGQPLTITATVRDAEGIAEVKLLYRFAGTGFEKPEQQVAMKETEEGAYAVEIPAPPAGDLIRYRISATGTTGARRLVPAETEPIPAFTAFVPESKLPATLPEVWIVEVAPGQTAIACADVRSNRMEVQGHANVEAKKHRIDVRLPKGHTMRQANDFQLAPPRTGRPLVGEVVAAELFRRSGIAVPNREFVRLSRDGRELGPHQWAEQLDRAFLRRMQVDDGGTLYKARARGGSVIERHENKAGGSKDDLRAIFDAVSKVAADPAAQWAILRKEFHVEQCVSYLAANTLLGNPDGFYDDYHAYHDVEDTARWMLYPGDLDRAWGNRAGTGDPAAAGADASVREPLPFTGSAAVPSGSDGRNATFARLLLTNPTFRSLYLARLRQLAGTTFSDAIAGAILDSTGQSLEPELRRHASALKENPDLAAHALTREIAWIRSFLQQRRQFIMSLPEVRDAGPFTTDGLEKPASKKAAKAANANTNVATPNIPTKP